MASENPEVAALQKQVQDLTAVVAKLTETTLRHHSVVNFPKRPVMFDDLSLYGPPQARDLMVQRHLIPDDGEPLLDRSEPETDQ